MATIFEQTQKLSILISTIPAATDAATRIFSAVSRKTYLRSTQIQDTLSQLLLFLIEKSLAAQLMKFSRFFDIVT
jgi:hypothetical protein